ncbi:FAD-binding oxidoreductase [bacterium]|nr:FAD-binding oxidoreductase [bacterium]MBU1651739.1 FAD-binding oxidoreductase [bacterium]MBU1882089.1 FAD-binding oxidoreductase [bacterium]
MDSEIREALGQCGCHLIEKLLPRVVVLPSDTEAIAKLVKLASVKRLRLCPTGIGTSFPANYDAPADAVFILMSSINEIIDLRVADAIVEVEAGMMAAELGKRLEGTDLQYPACLAEYPGTIGGALLSSDTAGLRHSELRRRLLAVKLVDARGQSLKFGSLAIKNVAGYDYWSFLVGTGGRFGVITRVILNVENMPPILSVEKRFEECSTSEDPAQWIYANLCKRLDPDGIFVR